MSLFSLCHMKIQRDSGHLQADCILILDFLASELEENKLMSFKPYNLWYFVNAVSSD